MERAQPSAASENWVKLAGIMVPSLIGVMTPCCTRAGEVNSGDGDTINATGASDERSCVGDGGSLCVCGLQRRLTTISEKASIGGSWGPSLGG